LANDTLKLTCQTSDTYRTLVRNVTIHHTYQPKEERSYRVVIKYLHHSVDVQDKQGYKVRNIINTKHRVTKDSLNLFFVDLEPSDNNK